jgi:hypothetical protein
MARNSVSERVLREHWERAQCIGQAYTEYLTQKAMGGVIGWLEWLNSGFELVRNTELDSTERWKTFQEKAPKISGAAIPIQLQFRRLLARQLNSGRKIAIGFRRYGPSRTEYRIVWDGKIQSAKFDFEGIEYRGPNLFFHGVRILNRERCDPDLLLKWDRLRTSKKGRPKFESIEIAIDRVFGRQSEFDNPALIKRTVQRISQELEEMRKRGETSEAPKEKTLENALRRKWSKLKWQSPTR